MNEEEKAKVWACITFTLANAELSEWEYRELQKNQATLLFMKTPKRKFGLDKKWTCYQQTRWKRKNRVKQLKRTISRLTRELRYEREYSRSILDAYNRLARIFQNAKQGNLLCTDAEQLSERKGN